MKASEEKRERLEAQSRRENLCIYGLSEDRNESWDDTENKVREYMSRDLELNEDDISIERAHRIQGSEKPGPFIVKFSFYKDKDRVLETYRQKRKDANELIKERETEQQKAGNANENPDDIDFGLFQKDITVCEDFPSRVMKARNDLRKFLKNAVADGKHAYLKYDKLVINDKVFEYDNEIGDITHIDK